MIRTPEAREKLNEGREVAEWVGSSPDAKVPPRVRLRIFDREQGVCWLSKRKIRAGEAWQLDHKVALCNGGEHRESNLAPALVEFHKSKTASDVQERVKTDRLRRKHLGIKDKNKRGGFKGWRNFKNEIVWKNDND